MSLDIISSTVMDQGEYTVEVRSASGSAHSTAKLMVQARKEMEPDYTRSEMMQQVEMKQVKQVSQFTQLSERGLPPTFQCLHFLVFILYSTLSTLYFILFRSNFSDV